MQIAKNADNQTFASASLDGTIKQWNLYSELPESESFSLKVNDNDKGVNCLTYVIKDKISKFLITGGDDSLVKVWDYEEGTLLKVLEGHKDNISDVLYVDGSDILLSASEDGTVKVWSVNDFTLLETLDYGMGKAWSLCENKGIFTIAFDKGANIVRIHQ